MNKFDEFIEAADKDLEVDTSTRVPSGSVTPPVVSSPSRSVSGGPIFRKRETHSNEGTKTYGQSKQFTPQRLSHQDHPLKEATVQSLHVPVVARPSNGLSKRRSLIQPVVAPKTPESNTKFNISAPTTLMADKSLNAGRKRSDSSISAASTDDINMSALLQNLANKELEILDTKQRIEELRKQLASEDVLYQERLKDLQELKEKVTSHFQKTANNNTSPTVDKTKTGVKENDKTRIRRLPDKAASTSEGSTFRENRPSVWSKSIAIFNQFDQILQHELERSLNWDEQPNQTPNECRQEPRKETEDALRRTKQTEEPAGVAKSLWNFVSDMKSGLLGIDEELENRGDSRSQTDSESNKVVGLGLKPFDSSENAVAGQPAVNDNKLRFVGGELSAEEEGVNKEVEMKDL